MRHRLKNVKNSYNGNGSLFMGHMIHVPMDAPLIGAGGPQQINEVSDTQLYVLGARLVTGDGRVFRYGKLGGTITSTKHGLKNNNTLVTEKGEIVSACAAGATSLTVTFNGDFNDVALAADELYGGYISLYNSSSIRDQRMIIGNTAVLTAGGACTIEIDEPIVTAVAAAFNCEVIGNPYSNLVNANDLQSSVMGMPASYGTSGQYIWIQTWGPYRVTPTGAEVGTNNDERMFHFDAYGSLRASQASIVTQAKSEQIAGFTIEKTAGSAGSAAPFIMLMISP